MARLGLRMGSETDIAGFVNSQEFNIFVRLATNSIGISKDIRDGWGFHLRNKLGKDISTVDSSV